jgi:hypothetical protein
MRKFGTGICYINGTGTADCDGNSNRHGALMSYQGVAERREIICLCMCALLPICYCGVGFIVGRRRRSLGWAIVIGYCALFEGSLALLYLSDFSWTWGWWL